MFTCENCPWHFVTGVTGEDHPLVEGSLDIVDLHEDSSDDGMARSWILEGF
jgi:hypothetical protein